MTFCFTRITLATLLAFSACKKESVNEIAASDSNQSNANAAHFIGEHYGGGVVFLINGSHGAIAAFNDIAPSTWRLGNLINITGAAKTGFGAGKANTTKIIQVQGTDLMGHAPYAALACAKYVNGGYSDWYLPSINELIAMYNQRNLIGGFVSGHYWSSTETNDNTADYAAWGFNVVGGFKDTYTKYTVLQVRPIRYY